MSFLAFTTDQSGAITVDWTVMTAAVVGLGVASVGAVRLGVQELGTDIQVSLTAAEVTFMEMPYLLQGLTPELAADRAALYANVSTEDIIGWHRGRAQSLITAIQAGHTSPTGNWSNLSAGETLDVLYLHRQELMARGAYPVDGVPDFNELRRIYGESL
jgi:hypothetical protein